MDIAASHKHMDDNRLFPLRRLTEKMILILYLCATLQFVRYYSKSTTFYLNLQAYLSGHERLPFQERVLPIFLIQPLAHSQWIARHLVHDDGLYTAEKGPFYVISLVSLLLAGFFVQRLYNKVSRSHTLMFLVYPIFLFEMMWSYTIHSEANFSYPYDMLSVAFFAAGLYVIYTRRYWALVGLMLLGTLNRETTLFLIGIFILDAASKPFAEGQMSLGQRFCWKSVPWLRVALLSLIWIAVKAALVHRFAHNDNSENYVRVAENIGRLKPRLWPALLNICGYMLPIVFLLRRYLRPVRFANYLFIFPVWFGVMFYTGVIVETRIYGELCSLVSISMVIIMEQYLESRMRRMPNDAGNDVVEEPYLETQAA